MIAITAKSSLDKPASHSSGERLADAADIVIDTCAPIEDAIVSIEGWSRPVSGSFHSAGDDPDVVTLHDTDVIYGIYRERMLEAQQKHLPQFKKTMAAEA